MNAEGHNVGHQRNFTSGGLAKRDLRSAAGVTVFPPVIWKLKETVNTSAKLQEGLLPYIIKNVGL
jgi:hypothetical protein